MVAFTNPTRIDSDPYPIQNPEQASTWQDRVWETGKEVALTSLPFLTLYKPFSYPVALGMGTVRVGVSAVQLAVAIKEGDHSKIFTESIGTTIAVISLVGTFFAHPLGVLISTGYDLILEVRNLVQHLRDGDLEKALQSSLKIVGHSLYFAVFLYGGPEIAICFLAVQILIGVLEARHEFIKGNIVSGIGHALMAILRSGQLNGQVKTLQLKMEIESLAKTIAACDPADPALAHYVGKLAEKWQFPSDHIPVGAKVGNTHVISWNVLNNHFMKWIIALDTQGINGSLISKLDAQKSLKYPGITLRDELVGIYLLQMMNSPEHSNNLILTLQECSPEFLSALNQMMPSHMEMILAEKLEDSIDHNVVIFNKENFTFLKDQSSFAHAFVNSDPDRPLMDLAFLENATKEKFQIINTHIPGDPNKPGRNEFAKYVLSHSKAGFSTIALGDMNFTEIEMQRAFDEEAAALNISNPLRNLAYYHTNISPYVFTSKSIDHIWVNTKLPCASMTPDEVFPGLQSTVDLLNPRHELLAQAKQAQELEELKRHYRNQQLQEAEILQQLFAF